MTARKCKSIDSRPTVQYDTRIFHSLDAWNRYTDNVLGRNILQERKVELYHTEFDDFKTELKRCNLHKRLTNLVDGSIDVALVKEFYANLYNSEGPSPKQARVRGHLVKIDADSLNTFLETLWCWQRVRLCPYNLDTAGCLQILGRLRLPYAYQAKGSS